MRTFTALIPVLVILGFAAPSAAGPGRVIEFEAVYAKTFNPTQDMQLQSEYVFRDEASWCGFWDLISGHASFLPDFSADCPAVDFRRAVVVAVVGFINGCDGGSRIASAERVGSRRAVDVVVEHFVACPESLCAQVFSWRSTHSMQGRIHRRWATTYSATKSRGARSGRRPPAGWSLRTPHRR